MELEMDIFSPLALLLILSTVWFWYDSLRNLETAKITAKRACESADVQFLDDTVAGTGIALARNDLGRLVLRRTYRFEFSETGNSRLEGLLTVMSGQVVSLTMEPYRILESGTSE
jgi:hypothetical protein